MPGTILKVLVTQGDKVAAGQALIVMESMKMEMTLSAPQAGWVSSVACSEGQMVNMGALLATLKELTDRDPEETPQ
jgi:biotin carboxyl carrier protein